MLSSIPRSNSFPTSSAPVPRGDSPRADGARSGSYPVSVPGDQALFAAHLICRESGVLMLDAVVGSNGRTYERAAAEDKAKRDPQFTIAQKNESIAREAKQAFEKLVPVPQNSRLARQGRWLMDPVVYRGETIHRDELPRGERGTRNQDVADAVQRHIAGALEDAKARRGAEAAQRKVSQACAAAAAVPLTSLGVIRGAITAGGMVVGGAVGAVWATLAGGILKPSMIPAAAAAGAALLGLGGGHEFGRAVRAMGMNEGFLAPAYRRLDASVEKALRW